MTVSTDIQKVASQVKNLNWDAESEKAKNKTRLEQAQNKMKAERDKMFKLFMMQAQNQDPTNPTDTNQMAAQTMAMLGIEQSLHTNLLLEELTSHVKGQSLVTEGASVTGKYAMLEGENDIILDSQGAMCQYEMPEGIEEAKIEILDNNGKVVASDELSNEPGVNIYKWSGKDSRGVELPEGKYSFRIIAEDKELNKPMPVKTYSMHKIQGFTQTADGHQYIIDGKYFPKAAVKTVIGFDETSKPQQAQGPLRTPLREDFINSLLKQTNLESIKNTVGEHPTAKKSGLDNLLNALGNKVGDAIS